MKSEPTGKYKYTKATIASFSALATGFGYSGGIYVAADLLRPSLSFIPLAPYAFAANSIFAVNVITWAALQYPGMQSIATSLFTPQEREDEITKLVRENSTEVAQLALTQAIAANIIKVRSTKNLHHVRRNILNLTRESLLKEISKLESNIKTQEEKLKTKTGWLYFASPGTAIMHFDLSQKRKKFKKLIALENAVRIAWARLIENHLDGFLEAEIDGTDIQKNSSALLRESFDSMLPQTIPEDLKSLGKTIAMTSMNVMTSVNAVVINSVGLAFYGAPSLAAMIGIPASSILYPTLFVLFGLVGYAGAKAFSRPGALQATQVLFGYSNEALEGMKLNDDQRENHGYFSLSGRYQAILAMCMAAGIAVSNYTTSAAFGEYFFSGLSLSAADALIPTLITSPFAVGTPSIILGLVSGLFTFCIVSTLLINGTLSATIKNKDKPLRNLPGYNEHAKAIGISTLVVASLSLAPIVLSGAPISMLITHAQPMMLTAIAMYGIYINHRFCQERVPEANELMDDDPKTDAASNPKEPEPYSTTKNFISDFLISTTVLTGALASAYLGKQDGSVWFALLGPTVAPFMAFLIGVANLELGLAMFRHAKPVLNSQTEKAINMLPSMPSVRFPSMPSFFSGHAPKAISPGPVA